MIEPDYETTLIREFNARLDAAEFDEEHGETPQDRRDRLAELQQDAMRDDGRLE